MSAPSSSKGSFFTCFAEINDNDQSSDGGSASNSDAEPELQDWELDDSSVINTEPEIEIVCDRNWRYSAPSNALSENETERDYNWQYVAPDNVAPDNEIICGRNWQNVAPSNVAPSERLSRKCSLTSKSENVQSIDECFHLFVNDEILDTIVLHTNKKAEASVPPNKTWERVDRTEINAFLGLLIIIGRFRESRESKKDIWKADVSLSRQIYRAVMSRDRFTDILRFIRFDDPETRDDRKVNDKLAPLRNVTDVFTRNCRESYNASDVGCVDEQLVKFRGRCSFKVYMPDKPGKYGIKIWKLCDSETYYCCNMDVYLGKCERDPEEGQAQRVVKRLMRFWRNSGRCIAIDHFFTDLALAEDLLNDSIHLVGTIRNNKGDLPKTLTETEDRHQYSSQFLFTDKLTLVSYVPKPRKSVILLSSLPHEYNISSAHSKFKPDIVNFYNSTKSGVEVLDKILRKYSCRLCTRRWPLSLFMHYVDIATYNAFVIWSIKHPAWEGRTSAQMKRTLFLEELGKKLTAEKIDKRATEFENCQVVLHKSVLSAIEATGRKIVKRPRISGQKRARCCLCIGSNNKYSTLCDLCKRHVCHNHSVQTCKILCNLCDNTSIE